MLPEKFYFTNFYFATKNCLGGSPYFGFYCIFINKFFENLPWGVLFHPPLPVCIYDLVFNLTCYLMNREFYFLVCDLSPFFQFLLATLGRVFIAINITIQNFVFYFTFYISALNNLFSI